MTAPFFSITCNISVRMKLKKKQDQRNLTMPRSCYRRSLYNCPRWGERSENWPIGLYHPAGSAQGTQHQGADLVLPISAPVTHVSASSRGAWKVEAIYGWIFSGQPWCISTSCNDLQCLGKGSVQGHLKQWAVCHRYPFGVMQFPGLWHTDVRLSPSCTIHARPKFQASSG